MSDFSKLKTRKNGKEYVLNACTQDTEQNITGTKNFTKLTVNSKNVVTSINDIQPDESGNVKLGNIGGITGGITGEIKWFAFNTAPDGYLVCNGAEVSRETYADLFAVIGTTFGSGDGSTTFNLPDLMDRFAEGSTTVGTIKSAGLPNITGGFSVHKCGEGLEWKGGVFQNSYTETTTYAGHLSSDWCDSELHIDFNASRSNSIYGNSSTVQPPALTLLPCIKY